MTVLVSWYNPAKKVTVLVRWRFQRLVFSPQGRWYIWWASKVLNSWSCCLQGCWTASLDLRVSKSLQAEKVSKKRCAYSWRISRKFCRFISNLPSISIFSWEIRFPVWHARISSTAYLISKPQVQQSHCRASVATTGETTWVCLSKRSWKTWDFQVHQNWPTFWSSFFPSGFSEQSKKHLDLDDLSFFWTTGDSSGWDAQSGPCGTQLSDNEILPIREGNPAFTRWDQWNLISKMGDLTHDNWCSLFFLNYKYNAWFGFQEFYGYDCLV